MKKSLSIVLVLVMLLTCLLPMGTSAQDVEQGDAVIADEDRVAGALPIPEDIFDAKLSEKESTSYASPRATTLVRTNNSAKKYFPVIGDQYIYGSCAMWSSVYYMYTYEVNRLHDTSATMTDANGNIVNDPTRVYSPTWNYSLFTRNYTDGTSGYWAYEFARDHGQLTLSDCPQYSVSQYPYPSKPADSSAMVNALATRLSNWEPVEIDTTTTQITVANSTKLDEVRDLIVAGHLLEVGLTSAFDIKETSGGKQCIYRVGKTYDENGDLSCGAHAMTVVGFDNSIWCDINGNGEQEDAECGAFILANSWGTTWGNDGFIYLSYDALNVTSAVSGTWESKLDSIRDPAFACDATDCKNKLTYIEVADYTVNYAAVVDMDVNSIYSFGGILSRDYEGTLVYNWPYLYTYMDPEEGEEQFDYSCKLAFDYDTLTTPIKNKLSGFIWGVSAANPSYNSITDAVLVDNLNTTIGDYTYNIDTYRWECAVDLSMGDLNYDGAVTMRDVMLLYQYTNGEITELSNVRLALSDMNDDGSVNVRDSALLYQQVSGSDAARAIDDEYAEFIVIMENLLVELGMK